MIKLNKQIARINDESKRAFKNGTEPDVLKKINNFDWQSCFAILGSEISKVESDNQFLRASIIRENCMFASYYEVAYAVARKVFETNNTDNMLRIWSSKTIEEQKILFQKMIIIRNNRKIYFGRKRALEHAQKEFDEAALNI